LRTGLQRKERRILLAGAVCATIALGGCGTQSDSEMRASYRQRQVDECVAASRNAPAPGPFDWPRFCGCVVDRYMAGKSAAELSHPDPQDPARRAISRQCQLEQLGGPMGIVPSGPDNGAQPAG
jgi:hypothetical protein